MSVAAEGTIRLTTMATTMGKIIFSFLLTVRSWLILILRSFSVVKARMMGG